MLAVLIALSTALEKLYFDQNFGSVLDYVSAFTWGIVTVAALETIYVALERLLRTSS